LLNLLWILGCIPIVTIGASTIAAYKITLQVVEDNDPPVVSTFIRAYKDNLLHGIVLTVTVAVLVVAVGLDFVLFNIVEGNPLVFLIIGIVAASIVFVHFFYVFPLEARYKNSLIKQLTNSRNIFIRYFLQSMLCTFCVATEVWLFYFNSWILLFVGFFLAPVLIMMTVSVFAMRLFRLIEAEGGVVAKESDEEQKMSDVPEKKERDSVAEVDSDSDELADRGNDCD